MSMDRLTMDDVKTLRETGRRVVAVGDPIIVMGSGGDRVQVVKILRKGFRPELADVYIPKAEAEALGLTLHPTSEEQGTLDPANPDDQVAAAICGVGAVEGCIKCENEGAGHEGEHVLTGQE